MLPLDIENIIMDKIAELTHTSLMKKMDREIKGFRPVCVIYRSEWAHCCDFCCHDYDLEEVCLNCYAYGQGQGCLNCIDDGLLPTYEMSYAEFYEKEQAQIDTISVRFH
jgi:hypothetical protein